jgi:hypothetical protein
VHFSTRKQKIFIALIIYILSVLFSVNLLVLKRDALQFHTRDFNYFVEQAARLTDPQLTKSFALQIEGYNIFGLQGIEGVYNLYHAIHTEYFRYMYVLLYGIFRDPIALFIFFSLIFYLPILYLAVLPQLNQREHTVQWLLFSLLYIIFPATLSSVTADLRPRVLIGAVWCLAVLAVHFKRPFVEKLIFFLMLIGIREEAIFLGAVLIGLNYIRMDDRRDRNMQTAVFLAIDILALVAFLAFMRWGGYTRVDNKFNPLTYLQLLLSQYPVFILVFAVLLGLLLWFSRKKNRKQFRDIIYLLCYSVAIGMAGFQWLRDTFGWFDVQNQAAVTSSYEFLIMALADYSTALVFYFLILLVVIVWEFTRDASRKLLITAYSLLIVFSMVITLNHYPAKLVGWRENVMPARLVWDFTAAHDRYNTRVMLDYDTYQAFYNYDKVIVYNRLPVWDAHPENRYYPQNKNALVEQIQSGMDFAVISRESLADILELASEAGVLANEIASNQRYIILEFAPGPSDQSAYTYLNRVYL